MPTGHDINGSHMRVNSYTKYSQLVYSDQFFHILPMLRLTISISIIILSFITSFLVTYEIFDCNRIQLAYRYRQGYLSPIFTMICSKLSLTYYSNIHKKTVTKYLDN